MNINICELLRNLPLHFVPFGVTITVLNEVVPAAGKCFNGDEHSSAVVLFSTFSTVSSSMSILRCFAFSSYSCLSTFTSASFVTATSLFSFTYELPFYIHYCKLEFHFLHIAFVLLCYLTP